MSSVNGVFRSHIPTSVKFALGGIALVVISALAIKIFNYYFPGNTAAQSDIKQQASGRERKIIFWCGDSSDIFDAELIEGIKGKLQESIGKITVEVRKFLDVDDRADCLYFRVLYLSGRLDGPSVRADSEISTTAAKGNCVWIAAIPEKGKHNWDQDDVSSCLPKSGIHFEREQKDHKVIFCDYLTDEKTYQKSARDPEQLVKDIVSIVQKWAL
ncbi:MAG TPA: hypothetical protein VIJ14_01210 [Rhabdochlamydiaceae bacterium]